MHTNNQNTCPYKKCAQKGMQKVLTFLETWAASAALLYARLWIALIFWKSAAAKVIGAGEISLFGINIPTIPMPYEIQSFTYILFEEEYGLPSIMAPVSTFMEILLPLMLVFGFGSRFAALGLFIMTLVIELTYVHSSEHIIWFMITAIIVTVGPGFASIDHFMRKSFLQQR